MSDPDLKDYITERWDAEQAETAQGFFDAMGLPMPRDGEYLYSNDAGCLVFLNAAGCVLRVVAVDKERIIHPYILQPIGAVSTAQLQLEINPALQCPVSYNDNLKLIENLRYGKIRLWDDKMVNAGYIPETPYTAQQPVLIDIGAAHKQIGYQDKPLTPDCAQSVAFGPLRQAFAAAWPDPGRMKDFWRECAQHKTQGLLKSNWLTQEFTQACNRMLAKHERETSYKDIINISRAYAAKWKNAP